MTNHYFRFYSDAERDDRTARWGARTTFFEIGPDGVPVRQIDIYRVGYVDRFSLDSPYIENATGERFGHIRTEPLDLPAVASNRISAGEFETSWASGQSREREFGEFKRELLVAEDRIGVFEAWYLSNSWYPHRPISDRLAIAERAVRELLAEGLARLCEGSVEQDGDEIPRAQHDQVLRANETWIVGDAITAHLEITDAGRRALDAADQTGRLP
jgi:hypothetical protein